MGQKNPEPQADYAKKARGNHQRRMAETRRKLHHVQKTAIDLDGRSWWPGDSGVDCVAIAAELAALGMVRASSRVDAGIFISNNPAAASIKARFVASLTGVAICDMAYIRGNGKTGICIVCKPVAKTRRLVSMTDSFMLMHPVLT